MIPLCIHSFPKAIVHIDGDSFFASCEQALNPKLKGKPVVTGRERGIAAAMSYEAKAQGVRRGMRLSEIRKLCPHCIILPSDYETYTLFSLKMYEIVRRYTPEVEEYSIDECFADITGLRRPFKMSYPEIIASIKKDLNTELGLTFSIGLGPTKVVAKIASNWDKPSGLTVIPGKDLHRYLKGLPLQEVWGIGPQTSAYLKKLGVRTALELAQKDESWIKSKLTKLFWEIWQELRGTPIYQLNTQRQHDYKSITRSQTFTPPSKDKNLIFSQLSRNIEIACAKLRQHKLVSNKALFYLKTQDFKYHSAELKFRDFISFPNEISTAAKKHFNQVFTPHTPYRATGIILQNLRTNDYAQMDLFGRCTQLEKLINLYRGVDRLTAKYGKHTVFLGASLDAIKTPQHLDEHGTVPGKRSKFHRWKTTKKRLNIPFMGEVS